MDKNDPPSINYTYILAPIKESPNMKYFQFIADSNYEEIDLDKNGIIDDFEKPSNAGSIYNAENYNGMRKVFWGIAEADSEYEKDQWGTFFSAYIPIKDEKGKVIVFIGIDMDVSNQRNSLSNLIVVFIIIIIISFALTLGISYLIARYLTRDLEILRIGVEKVRNRDFGTRIGIRSKDEIGMVADTFNSMVSEIREYSQNLEKQKEAFHRFVPNQFLEFLNKNSAIDIQLGDSNPNSMSVLFCDIRSFTTLTEEIGYDNVFRFLNNYMERMEPAIDKNHGFIDKYIGDAIMALFPNRIIKENESEVIKLISSGDSAVNAAIEMRKSLNKLNLERKGLNLKIIDIGIGIATGGLMLGIVGSGKRLEGTVIGETVNTASRLESLTTFYNIPILISDSTRESMKQKDCNLFREVDTVIPKGTSKPIILYEVFDADEDYLKELKIKSHPYHKEGLLEYKIGNFKKAHLAFTNAEKISPNDSLFQLYLNRCENYINNPPGDDWSGIWKFSRK
ncbi:MAG: HAMP domain-containing protein [Leptospiraceae bacterium]|nr:HAMP domain-containing protein [Leptospiraceae bacterium]